MTIPDQTDARYMTIALALARRGLGTVWPNPAVGCVVLDSGGALAGRGWTQRGGRPHAEAEALRRAGRLADGGTAYVSLEPCNHYGKTPPCTKALIEAGVRRVVIATEDPDERVSGSGITRLKEAGMDVSVGLCRSEAERLNGGYLKRLLNGRPLVTLKVATTLDGCIATHTGESQWITGGIARHWVQALRASHDAIVTGASTVRSDNPLLTCRLPGLEHATPVRVIMDSRLATPLTARIVATAMQYVTWMVTCADADTDRKDAFAKCGMDVIEVSPDDGGRPDVGSTLECLADRGITRVLVEGGSYISASMLRANAVDRIAWFRSPDIIGGDGIPVAQAFGVDSLSQMASFKRRRVVEAGRDMLELYERDVTVGPDGRGG